jgi:hypothetical protein
VTIPEAARPFAGFLSTSPMRTIAIQETDTHE